MDTVPINQSPSIDRNATSLAPPSVSLRLTESLRRGSLRQGRKLSLANFQEQKNWNKYADELGGGETGIGLVGMDLAYAHGSGEEELAEEE